MNRKKFLLGLLSIYVLFVITVVGSNLLMFFTTKKNIYTTNQATELLRDERYDAILVLGCGVIEDQPTPLLQERLDVGIELYRKGFAKKIIMSGDHGRRYYDEVNVMKKYAISKNVPSEDIFMDHAGFSTYDSMYRARDIFLVKRVMIVSQRYHLYRAVYISKRLGFDNVLGVDSTVYRMYGQTSRDLREIVAREKDFFKVIFKPKPIFLGESIDLNQSGDVTND